MIFAYGDESSDETHQRVFAVGAVVGSEEQWQALECLWLSRVGDIPFHAKDCDSDKGEYTKFSHEANKQLYADLTRLLAGSALGGWGVAINLIAQREVFPDTPDMSYYKGFSEVVEHMKNCAHYNNQTVKFVFDTRKESTYNTSLLFGMLRAIPEWKRFFQGELEFECASKNPRVQVADLFVREAMKALDNVVGPVKRPMRRSWKALLETDRFHVDALSYDWFLSLKKDMPRLEESIGASMVDYAAWLRDRNLGSDNISNRLIYIDLIGKSNANNSDR
jgi:hypothetical protein